MSNFSEKDVERYAKLARIRIEADQKPGMAKDMGGIFDWIEQIRKVHTEGVEPLITFGEFMPLNPDKVADGDRRDDILQNAPDSYMGFFAVPKVIE